MGDEENKYAIVISDNTVVMSDPALDKLAEAALENAKAIGLIAEATMTFHESKRGSIGISLSDISLVSPTSPPEPQVDDPKATPEPQVDDPEATPEPEA